MANNSEMIDVISPELKQQLTALNTQILAIGDSIDTVNKKFTGFKTPSQSDAGNASLLAQIKAQDEAIRNLQQAYTRLAQSRANVSASIKQETSATTGATKGSRDYAIAQQIVRNETDRNFRANTLLAGAYARGSAQLLILKKNLKDAAFQFGEDSAQAKKASIEFANLDGRIRAADKIAGDFQRNVGNYDSAGFVGGLKGAYSGLRQIAQILPGIGLAGIFGLALDPLLDLVKGLGLFNDKFAEMKQNFNDFAETQSKIRTGTRAAKEDFKALYDLATNSNAPLDEQNKAVQDLKKNYASFFGSYSDGAIKSGKAADAFNKANESIAAKQIVDNTDELKRKTEERIDLLTTELQARKDYAAEARRLQTEVNKNTTSTLTGGTLAGSGSQETLSDEGVAAKKLLDDLNRQNKERIEVLKNKKEENVISSSNAKIEKDIAYLNAQQAKAQDTYNKSLGKSLLLNKDLKEKRGASPLKDSTKELKDYDAALAEVTKANLQNAIKNNTDILNDETRTNEQRKASYEQLIKDKLQLAELEFTETKRQNEFKLNEDLRVAKVELDNVLNSKKATNDQRLKAEKQYNDKVVGLNTESQYKLLLNDVNYNQKVKELADDEFKTRKELADKVNALSDKRKENVVSEKQLDDIRQLNLLLTNVSPSTTDKQFGMIYDLRKHIAEDTTREILNIQIAANERELDNYRLTEEKKAEIQKQIDGLNSASGPLTEADQKANDIKKAELEDQLTRYSKESQAYADLKAKENQLNIDSANLDKKLKEENEARIKSLKAATLDYIKGVSESFYSNSGFGGLNIFFDAKLDEITKKSQSTFDKLFEGAENTYQKFAVSFQAITEVGKEAFDAIAAASAENFSKEKEQNEKNHDLAVKLAGDGAAAKIAADREYEKNKIRIEQREAKAAKKLAEFNIIITAAQAVVAGFKDGNILKGLATAAFIAAITAAQLSALNKASIPQYWKGTDNAPGGLAYTQERGREIITDKFGKIKSLGSDAGSELTMLSPGDKVKTAAETKNIMFDNGLNRVLNDRAISIGAIPNVNLNQLSASEYMSGVNRIENAVRGFKPTQIHYDRRGMVLHSAAQKEHIQSMNNRQNNIGKINP